LLLALRRTPSNAHHRVFLRGTRAETPLAHHLRGTSRNAPFCTSLPAKKWKIKITKQAHREQVKIKWHGKWK